MKRLLLAATLLLPAIASAEIYKCDQGGRIVYQDSPCAKGARELETPKIPKAPAYMRHGMEDTNRSCTLETVEKGIAQTVEFLTQAVCGKSSGVKISEVVPILGEGTTRVHKYKPEIRFTEWPTTGGDTYSLEWSVEDEEVTTAILTAGPARKILIELQESERERERERNRRMQAVGLGKVGVGMTEHEVRMSWGAPTKINRSSYGDQWVYDRGLNGNQYIYFKNGVVTSWN